ncbi:MAG: beta-galactosidase [Oscillospiraceae bacterium]|nr:beta-galactosidase [Oscillospiraceae bacterium]
MASYLTALPHMLHGADYNPEQWLDHPEILQKDIELMKLAGINCVSIGIFAWAALEPKEHDYRLDWLSEIIDTLYENGIYSVLATPSGAKPVWMAHKYPEIRRVNAMRVRDLQGGRHNHCYTSPIYRKKVRQINTKLAERFANHPAVLLWHISNEIQGECHCPLCQEAFRQWLKAKYGSLEQLNHAYWTAFWSHTYTDWSQIESPSPAGETNIHGLNLDWKRFCTAQTVDFFANEIAPLKAANPDLPVTANFMGFYDGIDYWKLLPLMDVVSWDSYPSFHNTDNGDESGNAMWNDAYSDICRTMLGKPYLLMENTPSQTNWHGVCRPKQPGFLRLSSIAHLAHGADSIQYFQFRQSRGSCEKFHGAVVSHSGRTDTRTFQEVSGVGKMLASLDALCGARVPSQTAILYDMENHWAVNDAKGPRNDDIGDTDLFFRFYRPFWQAGIPVDVVNADMDFSAYKLLCVPMLYLLRKETAQRLIAYVKQGGTLILTCHTGVVDEHDLCYLGDTPACGLAALAGVRYLETDPLYDWQHQTMRLTKPPFENMAKTYQLNKLCERIAAEDAKVLAVYDNDNPCEPDGMPVLTCRSEGRGQVYYLAAFAEDKFFADFLLPLAQSLAIEKALPADLPYGVCANQRIAADGTAFYFLQNWTRTPQTIMLPFPLQDVESGRCYQNKLPLPPYGAIIAKPQ